MGTLLLLLFSCKQDPPAPDACAFLKVPAPGPLAAERAHETDPTAIAKLFLREAQRSADPGFFTQAEGALDQNRKGQPEPRPGASIVLHGEIVGREGLAGATSRSGDRAGSGERLDPARRGHVRCGSQRRPGASPRAGTEF